MKLYQITAEELLDFCGWLENNQIALIEFNSECISRLMRIYWNDYENNKYTMRIDVRKANNIYESDNNDIIVEFPEEHADYITQIIKEYGK